jgi:hypothetical protein
MQRNFGPMRRQVEGRRQIQLTDDPAKLLIYRVLVETELDAPEYLLRNAHDACAGKSRFRRPDHVGKSDTESAERDCTQSAPDALRWCAK